MKKILILLVMLFTVVGCSCKKETSVKLDYEAMPSKEDSSTYLYNKYAFLSYEIKSTDEYDEKINSKDSFLLFIYSPTCTICQTLSPVLSNYVKENNIAIYTMDVGVIIRKTNHDLYKTEGLTTTPFLVLVEDGKIVYKLNVTAEHLSNDSDANKNWVKQWMEDHVIWEE